MLQQLRIDGELAETLFTGTVAQEEIAELFACFDRVIAEHGHVCILADLTQASTIHPQARRLAVDWVKRNHACICVALHGGSRPMRVVITLVLSAVRAIANKTLTVAFFDTEEEARRFLAPHRRSRSGSVPSTAS